ncbi:MAG: hypothetical protein IPJ19_19955 [Planctomycetes bacterium]|nr:hypothetical protein [Planctomycetota bacterium]
MKRHSFSSFAVLGALLALPALAQEPAARPAGAPGVHEPAGHPTEVDTALAKAREGLLAGEPDGAAHEQLVQAIRAGFGGIGAQAPGSTAVRARLVAAVDDLFARAKHAKIAPDELTALHVDVLDARALESLAQCAQKPGKEGLAAVESAVKELDEASRTLDPESSDWRERARKLLGTLGGKDSILTADLAPLEETLAQARCLRAEALLEKHATSAGAAATDFARARNAVSDLLEPQMARDPTARDAKQKLVSAIDELEQRSHSSRLERADFESLRSELALRTRAPVVEGLPAHG